MLFSALSSSIKAVSFSLYVSVKSPLLFIKCTLRHGQYYSVYLPL
jgi:hypothetical protein